MMQQLYCPKCCSSVGIDCKVHGPDLATIYCNACRQLSLIERRSQVPVPADLLVATAPRVEA